METSFRAIAMMLTAVAVACGDGSVDTGSPRDPTGNMGGASPTGGGIGDASVDQGAGGSAGSAGAAGKGGDGGIGGSAGAGGTGGGSAGSGGTADGSCRSGAHEIAIARRVT